MIKTTDPAAFAVDQYGRPAGMSWEQYYAHMERHDRMARRWLHRAALHEAGHATYALEHRIPFRWVAVRPLPLDFEWEGNDQILGPFDLGMVDVAPDPALDYGRVWLDWLLFTLAGPVAEAKFADTRRVRVDGGDRETADFLLDASRQVDRDQAMRAGLILARRFVDDRWPRIETLAGSLIRNRFLTAAQAGRIVGLVAAGVKVSI